jgi:hypothetical protein
VLDQVNVHEHPAFADLCAWDIAGTGLLLQGHGMDVQEGGGGLQIERVHARLLSDVCCGETLPA